MTASHLIPGAAARSRNVRNCGRAGHVPGVYPGQEEIMEKQLTEQADHLEKENRSGETGVETGVFRPSDSAAAAGSQEEFDQDRAQGAASPSAGDGSRTDADLESYPGVGHVRIRHLESRQISQEDIDRILQLTGQLEDFEILMMYYDCALSAVRTKLEVLNKEVALKKKRNPFESIKSRLKKPVSIYEKLKHRRIPFSVPNIEEHLTDVAGLRVICSFIDDIYSIRDSLAAQDDVRIIQEKDYIANPKPNGYRSLHLILEVPIYLMQDKKYMRVELQFRTIAMDFWASVEHKMKYKKEIRNEASIVEELHYSADLINQLDKRMQQIRDRIEINEEKDMVVSEWH